MSHTKAAFLINPLSHAVLKHGSVLKKTALNTDILRYELDPFQGLPKAIDDIINQGIKLVFIEGGDGTVQGVLTAFLNRQDEFSKLPQFVLVAGGMTNLVARHVGIKKPTPEKIEAILNAPKSAQTAQLPLLRVQYEDQDHSGFLFSTGAFPNGTRYCLDKIHTRGINGAAAVRTTLLRVLFRRGEERDAILGPTPMILKIDGETIKDDHIISLTTTLPGLMIGLNPFWGTGNGPVRISHVREGSKHLIINVARLFTRKPSTKLSAKLEAGGFRSWSVNTAILHHGGALVLDGEFLPQTSALITLSASQPLSFIK